MCLWLSVEPDRYFIWKKSANPIYQPIFFLFFVKNKQIFLFTLCQLLCLWRFRHVCCQQGNCRVNLCWQTGQHHCLHHAWIVSFSSLVYLLYFHLFCVTNADTHITKWLISANYFGLLIHQSGSTLCYPQESQMMISLCAQICRLTRVQPTVYCHDKMPSIC